MSESPRSGGKNTHIGKPWHRGTSMELIEQPMVDGTRDECPCQEGLGMGPSEGGFDTLTISKTVEPDTCST
jgi:hypothetical protein